MQVHVYTLSFGSLCAHRSVNPRDNASAYTPAKPETVATPCPAARLTRGIPEKFRGSDWNPRDRTGRRDITPLPETTSTSARFTVLDGRPVEISRGLWNSSAIGTRKRVQATAAQLGIAVLFLSTQSPSLNLIERRCKLTPRIQRCWGDSPLFTRHCSGKLALFSPARFRLVSS